MLLQKLIVQLHFQLQVLHAQQQFFHRVYNVYVLHIQQLLYLVVLKQRFHVDLLDDQLQFYYKVHNVFLFLFEQQHFVVVVEVHDFVQHGNHFYLQCILLYELDFLDLHMRNYHEQFHFHLIFH